MTTPPLDAVTGAFGYTGKYIARRLLALGRRVITLTGHPHRPSPFGQAVRAIPFHFDQPHELARSLEGVATLYNTYWVRFTHGSVTFDQAVQNTQTLIRAAQEAGVRRFVHVSIANPSADSPLPYYRGKALLERTLIESGLSHAILRPTVLFGGDEGGQDVLINNIAWLLRRFPLFAVPGDGQYRIQPMHVEDMAALAVEVGQQAENLTLDAVGPEIYTFNELVALLARAVGSRAKIVHLPPSAALFLSSLVGLVVRDQVLTRDELRGLMADLLVSGQPPTGTTRLSEWLAQHTDEVGRHYASELGRHFR